MAYTFVQIGTDPTGWVLENADPGAVAAQLSQATEPVVLPVVDPLRGDLLVSPSAATAISVQGPPAAHGWHPSHIVLPGHPVLYLPSPAGPTNDLPGYPLDSSTDLAALTQDLLGAMAGQTYVSVRLAEIRGGVLLLNGATLDFAVLARVDS